MLANPPPGFAAFARFIDEGEAAATCGFERVEGNAGDVAGAVDAVADTGGAAVRATREASSDALSGFHQAQRGPDWQPGKPTTIANSNNERMAESFMFRFTSARPGSAKSI